MNLGKNYFPWPRSAYAVILVLIAAFAVAAYWIYAGTRSVYRAVGFNDGQIHQREQTIAAIRRTLPLADCKDLRSGSPPVEFLSAKADSLFVSVANDGTVRFCR